MDGDVFAETSYQIVAVGFFAVPELPNRSPWAGLPGPRVPAPQGSSQPALRQLMWECSMEMAASHQETGHLGLLCFPPNFFRLLLLEKGRGPFALLQDRYPDVRIYVCTFPYAFQRAHL